MSLDQARQFSDQAAQCLQGGQPGLALDLAEQALMLQPTLGDAENLKGVALSQTGQPRAAEEAFARAARLMPRSAKPLYNLAVHFYGLGRKQDALDLAAQALDREPGHAQAFALQNMVRDGAPSLTPMTTRFSPYLELEVEAYGDDYRYEWLRESQAGWMALGWLLAATNLVAVALVVMAKPGSLDNNVPWYLFWLFIGSYILGFAYVAVDTAGRSRNRFWLAFYAVTGCVFGWGTLPLYLLTGKRRARATG